MIEVCAALLARATLARRRPRRTPGVGTPSRRASPWMIRASLRCSAARAPGLKFASSIRWPWSSRTRLAANPPSSASRTRAGSTPAAGRQDQRLGDRLDGGSHDQLVGGLGDLAGAAVADVDDPATHRLEHGPGALERLGPAADHDREAARDRPCLAARHRRVEEVDARRPRAGRPIRGRAADRRCSCRPRPHHGAGPRPARRSRRSPPRRRADRAASGPRRPTRARRRPA